MSLSKPLSEKISEVMYFAMFAKIPTVGYCVRLSVEEKPF